MHKVKAVCPHCKGVTRIERKGYKPAGKRYQILAGAYIALMVLALTIAITIKVIL